MDKKNDKPATLLEETATKYSVIPGIGIGEFSFRGQKHNLATLTVKEADALVDKGLDILVLKPVKSAEKKA